ncbi:MAG: LPS assembly lipoprotein LptE [Pseudomonadota bacterium]
MTKMLVMLLSLSVAACGFKPLYAVDQRGDKSGLRTVNLVSIDTSEEVEPFLQEAFGRRTVSEGEAATYDLFITAAERAERLAVQIDSTVTRYNYRLLGRYTLVNRKTGKTTKGRGTAVASFNVVSSQVSTLSAEKTAREKAARVLVEEIERDILVRLERAKSDT